LRDKADPEGPDLDDATRRVRGHVRDERQIPDIETIKEGCADRSKALQSTSAHGQILAFRLWMY